MYSGCAVIGRLATGQPGFWQWSGLGGGAHLRNDDCFDVGVGEEVFEASTLSFRL